MKTYRYELAKTPHGNYVLAILGQTGFAHYQTFPMTGYFEQKIRKIIRRFCEVPKRINYNKLPSKQFIEWTP